MTRATTSRLDYLGLGHIWSWRPDSNGLSPGYKAGTLSLRASPANFMEPRFGYDPKSYAYQAYALPLSYQGSWSQCPELHGSLRFTRAALC